jgi:hypothetical protein
MGSFGHRTLLQRHSGKGYTRWLDIHLVCPRLLEIEALMRALDGSRQWPPGVTRLA